MNYLIQVALKYDLYGHIRFNSSVEEARWDDRTSKWHITIRNFDCEEGGKIHRYVVVSDFLVSAVGQLSSPNYPNIKGLSNFKGKIVHSARWDPSYDLRGKRVGIIGTGATAAQIVPEVARECERLVVFQRSPSHVVPRHDRLISSARQILYKYIPLLRKRYRSSLMDVRESFAEALFSPESIRAEQISNMARRHLLNQLPAEDDTELRDALTPDHPFSCKRIIVSDEYYPAFRRPNVELESNPITEITTRGVLMADRNTTSHSLDLIILATGFRATEFLHPIRIFGTGGRPLSDIWSRSGPRAYLGITVESLPNFCMEYGPGTNLAHNSLILQIEAQSLYITALIAPVLAAKRRGQTLRIEPKPCVVETYNRDLQAKLSRSAFAHPGCTSWFKDEQGRILNNWAGSAIEYQKRVCFIDWSDFLIGGSGRHLIEKIPGRVTRWERRVEETRISDRVLCIAFTGITLFSLILGWGMWC